MRHADFGGRVKLGRNGKEGGFEVVTGAGSEICFNVCARGVAEFVPSMADESLLAPHLGSKICCFYFGSYWN